MPCSVLPAVGSLLPGCPYSSTPPHATALPHHLALPPPLRSPCSNVLLSDELRASVADLGVAQLLAKHCGGGAASPSSNKASSGSTAAGSSPPSGDAGTAEGVPVMAAAGPDGVAQMYAAPEQLAGQRCSTAADMYRWDWARLLASERRAVPA